jgi:hypothetical protein
MDAQLLSFQANARHPSAEAATLFYTDSKAYKPFIYQQR